MWAGALGRLGMSVRLIELGSEAHLFRFVGVALLPALPRRQCLLRQTTPGPGITTLLSGKDAKHRYQKYVQTGHIVGRSSLYCSLQLRGEPARSGCHLDAPFSHVLDVQVSLELSHAAFAARSIAHVSSYLIFKL